MSARTLAHTAPPARGAALAVDVVAVRLEADLNDFGSQLLQGIGRHLVAAPLDGDREWATT